MSYLDQLPEELIVEIFYTFDDIETLRNFSQVYEFWYTRSKNNIIRQVILNKYPEFELIIDDEYNKIDFSTIDLDKLFQTVINDNTDRYTEPHYKDNNLLCRYYIHRDYPIFYSKIKNIKIRKDYEEIYVIEENRRTFPRPRRECKLKGWSGIYYKLVYCIDLLIRLNYIDVLVYLKNGILPDEDMAEIAILQYNPSIAYSLLPNISLFDSRTKQNIILSCFNICYDINEILKYLNKDEIILLKNRIIDTENDFFQEIQIQNRPVLISMMDEYLNVNY